jgi:pheromone a factor receptor
MARRRSLNCKTVVRIQAGLNVAIPACSLCINRRLYKIVTNVKTVEDTRPEKRRAVTIDLLIGLGIPILQMVAREYHQPSALHRSFTPRRNIDYVVSGHRYNIFEDFGPCLSIVLTPPTFYLYYAWPVAIGCVSFVYCGEYPGLVFALWPRRSSATALTIYNFTKRELQFSQIISSNRNLNRGRYFRLMALSSIEILATIPLGTYWILYNAKRGVGPWKSWAYQHADYSRVVQVPDFIWKNNSSLVVPLESFRWSLVACAFIFFAFFGFADEARQRYRLVYTSLASRIGVSTSSGTLHESSHAYAYVVVFNT